MAKSKKASTEEVSVEYEGGAVRTYTGPDALEKAEEFVSKSPSTRKIL